MRKKFVATLALIFAMGLPTTAASGAVIRVGIPCTKAGLKSGGLFCSLANGKLTWQLVKKSQKIAFVPPQNHKVSDKSFQLVFSATSKLVVNANSSTPEICTVSKTTLLITGGAGKCKLTLTQIGNTQYQAAPTSPVEFLIIGINIINFNPPGAMQLKQGVLELDGSSSAGLELLYSSKTPEICSVALSTLTALALGKCTLQVSQGGSDIYPAAVDVTRSLEISGERVLGDLTDFVSGFQVKAVYVVPSDGIDNSYDTNGVITSILKEGNAFLQEELGLTLPIDSTSSGYDIAFLRSNKSAEYFLTSSGAFRTLLQESGYLDNPSPNRKDFVFFVDSKTVISSNYCGEASTPGISAIVAIGLDECGKRTPFFEHHASQTWVHEVIHNLGVVHVPVSCDLMFGGQAADGQPCPANQRVNVDRNHKLYLESSSYGADLLKLRVWNGYTADQGLLADCWLGTTNQIARTDKVDYALCPTGTTPIGALNFCWTRIDSAKLEESINGIWVSLGDGNQSANPWGSRVDWSCNDPSNRAPWKSLTVLSPGLRHYRWIINGAPAGVFNIIWQN